MTRFCLFSSTTKLWLVPIKLVPDCQIFSGKRTQTISARIAKFSLLPPRRRPRSTSTPPRRRQQLQQHHQPQRWDACTAMVRGFRPAPSPTVAPRQRGLSNRRILWSIKSASSQRRERALRRSELSCVILTALLKSRLLLVR